MTLDEQYQFLTKEIQQLQGRSEGWARDKLQKMGVVRETIRALRQQQVMTSEMTGKRIGS
mgnify:CR=1 FL=1